MNLRRFISVCAPFLFAMGLVLGGCQKKEEAAKMEEQPAAAQEQPATAPDTTKAADTTHVQQ